MTSISLSERGQTIRITDEAPVAMGGAPAIEVAGEGPIPPGLYAPQDIIASDGKQHMRVRDALVSQLIARALTGEQGKLAARVLAGGR